MFEIETAAAFLLFSRHPADVVLLEVGLGGRLDATNVVERPLASVITRVSLDHREFLGDTHRRDRRREGRHPQSRRAGRRHRPAARGARGDRARRRRGCGRRSHVAGENWTATEERGRLVYQDSDGLLDLPAPKLYGRHQFENAGAAIAALRVSGLKLPAAAFEAGMTAVDWPARMQRLSHGRLAALAPPESELWLDGGHNADGGRAIAAALADLEERVSRPLVLIVGMLSTKDNEGFLRNFAGLARRVIAVPIHQDKAVPAAELAERRRQISAFRRWRATISKARSRSPASSISHPAPRILDHRLALSGRRGIGAKRHRAAGKNVTA